ncbi:hypothetical protein MBLNU230_g2017t1 [Neophaeotheca triangularis]
MRNFEIAAALLGMLTVVVAEATTTVTAGTMAAAIGVVAGSAMPTVSAITKMATAGGASATTSLLADSLSAAVHRRAVPFCCYCVGGGEHPVCWTRGPSIPCEGCPGSDQPESEPEEGLFLLPSPLPEAENVEPTPALVPAAPAVADSEVNPPVTTDGTCGPSKGRRCGGSGWGDCCSYSGRCTSTLFCHSISSFGAPWSKPGKVIWYRDTDDFSASRNFTAAELETLAETPVNAKSAVALPISRNGRCGPNGGGRTCAGFPGGSCCSIFGYCGFSSEYCANEVCLGNPYGTCSFASIVPPGDKLIERNPPAISFQPTTSTSCSTTLTPTADPIDALTQGLDPADIEILTAMAKNWNPTPSIEVEASLEIEFKPTTGRFTENPKFTFSPRSFSFHPSPTIVVTESPVGTHLAKRQRYQILSFFGRLTGTWTEYEPTTTITASPTTTTVELAYAGTTITGNPVSGLVTLVNPLVPSQTVVREVDDEPFPASLSKVYTGADQSYSSIDINTFKATGLLFDASTVTTASSTTNSPNDTTTAGIARVTNVAQTTSATPVTSEFEQQEQAESSGKALIGHNGSDLVAYAMMGMLACLGVALLL